MRIVSICIASLLLASVTTAEVNSSITSFLNRTGGSAFDVDWTVSQADATACTAGAGACCFNAVTLVSTLTGFVFTLQGAATGTACVSSSLTVTLTGTANSSFISGNTIDITSDMTAATTLPTQTLLFLNGSSEEVQFYKLRLPSDTTTYTATSLNLASLPLDTSTSASVVTISLISLLAIFL